MASPSLSAGRHRRVFHLEDDSAPSPIHMKEHPMSQSSSQHSFTSSDDEQLDHSIDTLDEQSSSSPSDANELIGE